MNQEVQPECLSSLDVGTFRLEMWSDGRFWIWRDDGEGGEFSLDEFEKVIEKFYKERL